MKHAAANDTDAVEHFQKLGAIANRLVEERALIEEMLRYPDELRRAYEILMERETPSLTQTQREVLEFIRAHQQRTGLIPSYREIAAACGFSGPSKAYAAIKGLERRGAVKCTPNAPRSLVILTPSPKKEA